MTEIKHIRDVKGKVLPVIIGCNWKLITIISKAFR
jgi:hypothetical protein